MDLDEDPRRAVSQQGRHARQHAELGTLHVDLDDVGSGAGDREDGVERDGLDAHRGGIGRRVVEQLEAGVPLARGPRVPHLAWRVGDRSGVEPHVPEPVQLHVASREGEVRLVHLEAVHDSVREQSAREAGEPAEVRPDVDEAPRPDELLREQLGDPALVQAAVLVAGEEPPLRVAVLGGEAQRHARDLAFPAVDVSVAVLEALPLEAPTEAAESERGEDGLHGRLYAHRASNSTTKPPPSRSFPPSSAPFSSGSKGCPAASKITAFSPVPSRSIRKSAGE